MRQIKNTFANAAGTTAAIALAIVVLMAVSLTGCDNLVNDLTPTDVTIAVIKGVTAPVTGAAPVMKITETDQYSGTIVWSPAVSGAFAAKTEYTATITLRAKSGFTLQGVTADFFTVEGATATNAAGSGIVTAVFPHTGGTTDSPAAIDIAAIGGITAPVIGGIPVTVITETAQYTGTIVWSPADDAFKASTIYTATITLTAKTGFTLTGVGANFFTVKDATATNPVNSGVVTAVFPSTDAKAVSSIVITTQPIKTTYNIGETLSTTGMVVTATYSDSTTEAVTGYTTSGFDSATEGQKTVTVTYESKTATFTVTVNAAAGDAFTSIADFATWLAAQPANTTSDAFTVKLNVSDLGGSADTSGSAGAALKTNNTKYINLDLSGSTFTSFAIQAFWDCTGLTSVTIPDSRKIALNNSGKV